MLQINVAVEQAECRDCAEQMKILHIIDIDYIFKSSLGIDILEIE